MHFTDLVFATFPTSLYVGFRCASCCCCCCCCWWWRCQQLLPLSSCRALQSAIISTSDRAFIVVHFSHFHCSPTNNNYCNYSSNNNCCSRKSGKRRHSLTRPHFAAAFLVILWLLRRNWHLLQLDDAAFSSYCSASLSLSASFLPFFSLLLSVAAAAACYENFPTYDIGLGP